jgi:16S rRNA (cytosine967-C5)-methyltransferase
MIDFESWQKGLLYQRPVYVVINKSYTKEVSDYFKTQNLALTNLDNQIVQLPPDTPVHELEQKGWLWVMDIASFKTIQKVDITPQTKVWDCCSGSGGKSIYLRHQFGNKFPLTVSDLRSSILENLKKRFSKLNFRLPDIKTLDLTIEILNDQKFDVIIADVPCSGSGTWGRNPENISRIKEHDILKYADLQKRITSNAILSLNSGGIYIT